MVILLSIIGAIIIKLPFNNFIDFNWYKYCSLQSTPCSQDSTKFLQTNKLTKNLFTYYDWGGWLIWNYPDIKPSIDGRMIAWTDEKGYSAAYDYEKYWSAIKSIENSKFDIAYLPQDRSPIYMELSDLVKQNKWNLVYQDDNSIIVARIKK
jgi:hypothetical protein